MNFTFLMSIAGSLLDLIPKVKAAIAAFQRSGKMTESERAEFDDRVKGTFLDPAWDPNDPSNL